MSPSLPLRFVQQLYHFGPLLRFGSASLRHCEIPLRLARAFPKARLLFPIFDIALESFDEFLIVHEARANSAFDVKNDDQVRDDQEHGEKRDQDEQPRDGALDAP